jgi:hypothetical protein
LHQSKDWRIQIIHNMVNGPGWHLNRTEKKVTVSHIKISNHKTFQISFLLIMASLTLSGMSPDLADDTTSPRPLLITKMGRTSSMQALDQLPPAALATKCNGIDLSDVTPRAISHSNSGKSSSYKVLRSQAPQFLNKLRSFSNGRILFSRATCGRYSLQSRGSSVGSLSPQENGKVVAHPLTLSNWGSSSSEGSYDPDPLMPLGFGMFDSCRERQTSKAFHYANEIPSPLLEPSLLIPQIRIIPQSTTLADGNTAV